MFDWQNWIITIVGAALIWDSFFIVRQKTAVVIERLGKFVSVRFSGFQVKWPIIDRKVFLQNLRIQTARRRN